VGGEGYESIGHWREEIDIQNNKETEIGLERNKIRVMKEGEQNMRAAK
jgi:hypothetical protein